MTQTQMTAYLADKIGISKRQAKSALDDNELVTGQLKREGLLRLAGLGVFRKRKLKARVGRNPAPASRSGTERFSARCSVIPKAAYFRAPAKLTKV
jgi:nucleoid DNA-binding protein